MTTQHSQPNETGFSLRLLNHACDGAASLRDSLIRQGMRPQHVARAAGVSLRTLANCTDGARTRRGMLVRLAGLAVIVDQLVDRGIPVSVLWSPRTVEVDRVIQGIRAQSPIAAKLVDALDAMPTSRDDTQLSFPMAA